MSNYVVGIDLGGTKIALGLIAPDNTIIAHAKIPTQVEAGPASAASRIAASIDGLRASLPAGESISAVGICSPGPLDHERGMIIDPPNLPGWRNVPLRQMLADELNLPVVLEHDAKAAALGEFYFGAGQGVRSMVYLVIGTGVGAAIIIDGVLYRGLRNFAGEMGHMTIDRHGPAYETGIRGSVQEYCRGPALARDYIRLKQTQDGEAVEAVTGEDVAQAAAAGDSIAQAVMQQAGEAVGIAVASMAMILDIDLYVIGGSVIKSGELLLAPAREILPRFCLPSMAANIQILPAARGNDSPLLGCGWQARNLLG